MNINKAISSIAMCAVMGLAVVGAASANISPQFPGQPASVTPVSGGFLYTYTVSVDAQQTVMPGPTGTGDFFTFYDIQGYVPGSASVNSGYTSFTTLQGPTATGATGTANPTDSAVLPNLTFSYNGPSPLVGAQGLGSFSFVSLFGTVSTTPTAFVGRASISQSNPLLKNANVTSYFGPVAPAVPEPASVIPFALGGLGLLGLIVRKTRRTSGAAA